MTRYMPNPRDPFTPALRLASSSLSCLPIYPAQPLACPSHAPRPPASLRQVSIQFQIVKDDNSIWKAYYRLTNPRSQIEAYVYDVVRSTVPKIDLDDVFVTKEEISAEISTALKQVIGYSALQPLSPLRFQARLPAPCCRSPLPPLLIHCVLARPVAIPLPLPSPSPCPLSTWPTSATRFSRRRSLTSSPMAR